MARTIAISNQGQKKGKTGKGKAKKGHGPQHQTKKNRVMEKVIFLWQCKKKIIVTCPEKSYVSNFIDQKKWNKVLNMHVCRELIDLQHVCNCDDEIKDMIIYPWYAGYTHDLSW